jgi:hypothetical protein
VPAARVEIARPKGTRWEGERGLASAAQADLLFHEELLELHPEGLGHMPKGDDRGVSLAKLQPTDVGTVNSHPRGKLGLERPAASRSRRTFPPDHLSHVFRHGRIEECSAIYCDALYCSGGGDAAYQYRAATWKLTHTYR